MLAKFSRTWHGTPHLNLRTAKSPQLLAVAKTNTMTPGVGKRQAIVTAMVVVYFIFFKVRI